MNKIEELLNSHSHATQNSLISILQQIQDEIGFLSEEAIDLVSKHLKIPSSKIYGLATFYNQFRFKPKGKFHVQVCQGTSCHMKGAQFAIDMVGKNFSVKPGHTSRNGMLSLEVIPCMGACAQSPVVTINEKSQGLVTPDKLKEFIEKIKNEL